MSTPADHLVKLVHARDLAQWHLFPAYEEHIGKTLAQYRAEVKARNDLEHRTWKLREAQRVIDGADAPKRYRTQTVESPWPISLPGRQSVRLPAPAHLNTTYCSQCNSLSSLLARVENILLLRDNSLAVHLLEIIEQKPAYRSGRLAHSVISVDASAGVRYLRKPLCLVSSM